MEKLAQFGRLRACRSSVLALVWLMGKLLYASLIERRARRRLGGSLDTVGSAPNHYLVARLEGDGRRMDTAILGVEHWHQDAWSECFKVLTERSRRRKLQTLPPPVIHLLHPDQPLSFSLAA